jgi:hypothetical protein
MVNPMEEYPFYRFGTLITPISTRKSFRGREHIKNEMDDRNIARDALSSSYPGIDNSHTHTYLTMTSILL